MTKWETRDFGGAQIVFPIRLERLAFRVASVGVVNNTPATLYLSRSVGSPTQTAKDVTVPSRFSTIFPGWYAEQLYVGSDGTAIGSGDSITFQLSDEDSPPPGSNINPSSVVIANRFFANLVDTWGFNGQIVSIASATVPTPDNLEFCGYQTFGFGSMTFQNAGSAGLNLAANSGSQGCWSDVCGVGGLNNAHRRLSPGIAGSLPNAYAVWRMTGAIRLDSIVQSDAFAGFADSPGVNPLTGAVNSCGLAFSAAIDPNNWLALVKNGGTITSTPVAPAVSNVFVSFSVLWTASALVATIGSASATAPAVPPTGAKGPQIGVATQVPAGTTRNLAIRWAYDQLAAA